MIPLISRIVVEDKKWINDEEMMDCIVLGQSLPGVIAINSAAFVGYKKRGIKGGVMATLGVTVPSFLIILILANIIGAVNDSRFVQGAMVGIKACVTGLVVCVAYNIGKKTLEHWFQGALAIIGFLAVAVFDINAIIAVLVAGILGLIYYTKIKVEEFERKNDERRDER